ncbi:MAG: MaoC family dehydratase, partial [Halieaceae bacterium]
MATQFDSPAALLPAVGQHLGFSEWLEIDQRRIDLFAESTGDHQWIHVDPERAASGPFGKTIAHGYLTLSLANLFLPEIME